MANSAVNNLAPQTPEEIANEAEAGVLGGASFVSENADPGVTPNYFEDLDDPTISAVVGPGALEEPVGRTAAREALRQFPNEPAPITPAHAEMLNTVGNLDAQTAALRAVAGELGGAAGESVGEYYGDLRTGQVMLGAQIPEDQRIGPFHSAAVARAAVVEARRQFTSPV